MQRGFFSNWVRGFFFAKTDQEGRELLEQACFVGSFVVFVFCCCFGEGVHKQSSMGRRRVPPGFRFHPTDEELVVYYLKRKVIGRAMAADVIAMVDLYKCEPWDLPGMWRWQEACLSVGFVVVSCCTNSFFLSTKGCIVFLPCVCAM